MSYGCDYCGSCSCDSSCEEAYMARRGEYKYEWEQAEDYWSDPWNIFGELVNDFLQDKMTTEKFIADAACLEVIDNFEIIKVIQDKKEQKQKDLTNA
jgi:hypothetical protein